jgi:hypothetical protein
LDSLPTVEGKKLRSLNGATTFSIMTIAKEYVAPNAPSPFHTLVLSINLYSVIMARVVMQNVILRGVVMLIFVMLSVIILRDFLQIFVRLTVMAPFEHTHTLVIFCA